MIELCQVSVRAGDFRLDDLSFEVRAGELAVLMGKTGSGKTTILEAICGLRRINAGAIRLCGAKVDDLHPADRGVGYVPQDLALFPTLTVGEHLAFALRIRRAAPREIDQRIAELAQLLGIQHLLPRRPAGLSGGESQRVALGRALSFKPRVLLLDEPFSALDEDTRGEMVDLLRRVQQQTSVTTLHVTHARREATALADRLLVLQDGQIRETPLAAAEEVAGLFQAPGGES